MRLWCVPIKTGNVAVVLVDFGLLILKQKNSSLVLKRKRKEGRIVTREETLLVAVSEVAAEGNKNDCSYT